MHFQASLLFYITPATYVCFRVKLGPCFHVWLSLLISLIWLDRCIDLLFVLLFVYPLYLYQCSIYEAIYIHMLEMVEMHT
jgi:hypothetical protein